MRIPLLCAFLSVGLSLVAQAPVHRACSAIVGTNVSTRAPAIFTGSLQDDKNTPIAKTKVELASLDKKAPKVYDAVLTDSQGAFHFDSVPAGRYAITVIKTGWTGEKVELHCATDNSCRVAFVLKSSNPHDCYNPNYVDDNMPSMRH